MYVCMYACIYYVCINACMFVCMFACKKLLNFKSWFIREIKVERCLTSMRGPTRGCVPASLLLTCVINK